ncbi:MAG: DUF899 domain-containing protein [Hyphomicrobiaceae bacterium]
MAEHQVVSRNDWLVARKALLVQEKELTAARDKLARERRALPWVKIDKSYKFASSDGNLTLTDLFGNRGQLIVSHFMFAPDWDEGCTSCSFWADGYDPMVVHLAARDVSFAAVSRAPLAKLDTYKRRMGWSFPWVSSLDSDFNRDFGVTFTREELDSGLIDYNYAKQSFPLEEAPGLSVFLKENTGEVFHTYSCYARGLDMMNAAYHLLDLVPKGRDEGSLGFSMAWLRRHDQY